MFTKMVIFPSFALFLIFWRPTFLDALKIDLPQKSSSSSSAAAASPISIKPSPPVSASSIPYIPVDFKLKLDAPNDMIGDNNEMRLLRLLLEESAITEGEKEKQLMKREEEVEKLLKEFVKLNSNVNEKNSLSPLLDYYLDEYDDAALLSDLMMMESDSSFASLLEKAMKEDEKLMMVAADPLNVHFADIEDWIDDVSQQEEKVYLDDIFMLMMSPSSMTPPKSMNAAAAAAMSSSSSAASGGSNLFGKSPSTITSSSVNPHHEPQVQDFEKIQDAAKSGGRYEINNNLKRRRVNNKSMKFNFDRHQSLVNGNEEEKKRTPAVEAVSEGTAANSLMDDKLLEKEEELEAQLMAIKEIKRRRHLEI